MKRGSRQHARGIVGEFAREMVNEGMELVEIEFEMCLIARDSMIDWEMGEEMTQQDTKWVEKMVKEEWAIEVENAGAADTEEAGDGVIGTVAGDSEIEVQPVAEGVVAELDGEEEADYSEIGMQPVAEVAVAEMELAVAKFRLQEAEAAAAAASARVAALEAAAAAASTRVAALEAGVAA